MSTPPADPQADRYARNPDGRTARFIRPLRDFLHQEASAGMLLVAAAVIALIWANSPWSDSYFELWSLEFGIEFDHHVLALNLKQWVNDLLMVLFFFVVGLEIKRELTEGELRDPRQAATSHPFGQRPDSALPTSPANLLLRPRARDQA